jgi:hypothetical protein
MVRDTIRGGSRGAGDGLREVACVLDASVSPAEMSHGTQDEYWFA